MHGNFSNIVLSMNVSESSFTLDEIEENQDLDQDSADEEQSHYNEYISDSELQEIQENGSIFTSLDDLKLKEYRNRLNKKDEMSTTTNPIFLNVNLKNVKEVTVRKSLLCWYFTHKKSRLSTDRIVCVRGEVKEHQKEKLKRPTCKTQQQNMENMQYRERKKTQRRVKQKS